MNKEEKKRVINWLYSIRRSEITIERLQRKLEALENRKASPPTWMTNPDALGIKGGSEDSKQQIWVEFLDSYPTTKEFYLDNIEMHQERVKLYYDTLEAMKQDQKWGYMAGQVIHYKFYKKVKPDIVIYSKYLCCDHDTYYKYQRRGLKYFLENYPELFVEKTDKSTDKKCINL